ncbi:MAG: Gfo/Idh/MocA family oxidoreductase [Acetatifactor sp.]|nr:Gfo/Idh/MocA family oxidoreductase [Acetatifactor sp.]
MGKLNVAIMGAGNIAGSMAAALAGIKDEVVSYAVASRDIEKAKSFADKWGFQKAYGSYEELVEDNKVDLIYIATPHAMHYENAKLALTHDKAVLVEKAFTANKKQATELVSIARERKVLLAEAIWTRYLPARKMIEKIIAEGRIGEVKTVEADFSVPICEVPRLREPALAGGALLDLGVYTLTFASMFLGDDVASVESDCILYQTGVDATDRITLHYADGKTAYLRTSMVSGSRNEGFINGTKGYIYVNNLNNLEKFFVYDEKGKLVEEIAGPMLVNGYEYEVLACKEALESGAMECEQMPHSEILTVMGQMDSLRAKWGVVYPFETMRDLEGK